MLLPMLLALTPFQDCTLLSQRELDVRVARVLAPRTRDYGLQRLTIWWSLACDANYARFGTTAAHSVARMLAVPAARTLAARMLFDLGPGAAAAETARIRAAIKAERRPVVKGDLACVLTLIRTRAGDPALCAHLDEFEEHMRDGA